jgi:general secretion pathway protein J
MELMQSIKTFDANRYLTGVTGLRIVKSKSETCAQHPLQQINPKIKIQNPKFQREGFTLIEMLLAISIFSMVVAIIFSSFSVGLGSWEKGERDIEYYQRLRSVTELLFRQINSTYPYSITPGELDKHKKFFAFFGESDSIKFVSYANLHKRAAGLSLLELWVKEGEGLMLGEEAALVSNLSDLEDIDLREEDRSVLLFPEVKKIDLRYFGRKTKNDEGEWLERWDPKDKKQNLPLFVEIMLSLTEKEDEESSRRLIVPIMFTGKKL